MTDIMSRAFRDDIFSIVTLIQGELDARDLPRVLTALLALKRVADQRAEQENQSCELSGFLAYAPLWDEIRTAESPGEVLTAAYSRLEQAHPGTERWFDDLKFSPSRDELWKEIIAIVSGFSFSDADLNDPEVFSDVILQFYHEGPARRGSFETPPVLAHLIVDLLAPESGASVFDIFCQDGTALVEAARYVRGHGERGGTILYAQTPTEYARLVTALNLLMHNCPDTHIATGDTLLAPGFVKGRRLATFDRVVCTFPAGARDWGSEILHPDPYLRFIYGVPPRTSGEYAYLSHAIASLADGGRLAAVVPAGVLFRTLKTEKEIRTAIINDDRVEAVISLPGKVFFPMTSVEFAVIVIAAGKKADRQEKTIFIDASNPARPGKGRDVLREEDVKAVREAYTAFRTVEGFSAVATIDEIAAQDFNLEVSRYVQPVSSEEQAEPFDIDAAIAELKTIRERKEDALNRFLESVMHLEHEQR